MASPLCTDAVVLGRAFPRPETGGRPPMAGMGGGGRRGEGERGSKAIAFIVTIYRT